MSYPLMIARVAQYINKCDALVIFSGAGMSVDSGLPDFSSDQGIIQKIVKTSNHLDYRNIINP